MKKSRSVSMVLPASLVDMGGLPVRQPFTTDKVKQVLSRGVGKVTRLCRVTFPTRNSPPLPLGEGAGSEGRNQ